MAITVGQWLKRYLSIYRHFVMVEESMGSLNAIGNESFLTWPIDCHCGQLIVKHIQKYHNRHEPVRLYYDIKVNIVSG